MVGDARGRWGYRGTEDENLAVASLGSQSGRGRRLAQAGFHVSQACRCRVCRDSYYPNTGRCHITNDFTEEQIEKGLLRIQNREAENVSVDLVPAAGATASSVDV